MISVTLISSAAKCAYRHQIYLKQNSSPLIQIHDKVTWENMYISYCYHNPKFLLIVKVSPCSTTTVIIDTIFTTTVPKSKRGKWKERIVILEWINTFLLTDIHGQMNWKLETETWLQISRNIHRKSPFIHFSSPPNFYSQT